MPTSLDSGLRPTAAQPRDITISGVFPWVEVTGTLQDDGTVEATGRGLVAGVPNIDVRFDGTLDANGRLMGDYSMDNEKQINANHPIVYSVDVQRQ